MTSRELTSSLHPGAGFEIAATFTGINRFCSPEGPCIPSGEGEFGWVDFKMEGADGTTFRLGRLTWPEADLPGIIESAREAIRRDKKELRIRHDPHVLVVSGEQIHLLIDGLSAFLEHQNSCPNRRCP